MAPINHEKVNQIMRDDDDISRNLSVRQATFFSKAKERGYSLALLSVETGISVHTLGSYVPKPSREHSLLPLTAFIKLARIKGLEDLSSLLIEDSLHGLTPLDPSDTNWDGLAAEAAGLVADVCTARADGKIDHVEAAKLKERTRKLIADAQGAVL